MTFKEKYNSIDQSKLPETAKAYMADFKKDSDNFTNKQAMALMMPVLDRFIKGLKDSGYGDAIKGGAKKETKKAETPKEMAKEIVEEAVEQPETKTGKPKVGKISKGDFMKIAKEIRKEGESWNSAMKRAGDIIRTQKEVVKKEATRQYEKLKKFIEKHPEVYPMDIPVRGGGFRKTTVNRDAPRVALPKGKRVSKAGWKNQYGKSDGGKIYYEYRSNRYDTRRQRYPFLAEGGELGSFPFLKFEDAQEAMKKVNKGELPKWFSYVEKEKTLYYLPNITGDWVKLKSFETKEKSIEWVKYNLKAEGFAEGGEIDAIFADGGMTKRIIALPVGTKEQIEESIRMGFDTLVEGMISPKTRGVMLIDKDSNVRGAYPMLYKGAIEEMLHNIKGYAKGGSLYGDSLYEKATKGQYLEKYSKNGNLVRTAEQFDSGNWVVSVYSGVDVSGEYSNEEFNKEIKKYFNKYAKGGELDINQYADNTERYSDILNEYETTIVNNINNQIKYWQKNNDESMVKMLSNDLKNHLSVIEYMREGFWNAAYDEWRNMDTSSREEITNRAYELLMEKNNLPTYANGGELDGNLVVINYGGDRYDGGVVWAIEENGVQIANGIIDGDWGVDFRGKHYDGLLSLAKGINAKLVNKFDSDDYAKGGELDINKYAGAGMFAKGGEINERMYNFLVDDLANLEKAVEENNQEEIDKFFSYWNQHLPSLKTETNERMYNFLVDDLANLEKAVEENNQEEIDKFFSYWNYHLSSLKMAKGGYTATGEDYEYVNTFGIAQPDFEEIVEAWHKGNSLRNTDRINSRLVFRKMENKYGEDKIEEVSEYIMKTHEGHEHYAKGGEMGKLGAGVYRVGKPKKVSPYSYEQKIVEIFENGDISTASDYARKAADFHSLSKYPVISEKQLEAQYKYAEGGLTENSQDYFKHFDLNEEGNFAATIDGNKYEIIYRDDVSQLYDLFKNGKLDNSSRNLRGLMKFAKGGGISKSTTYIPNRDIESVNAKINNKKVSLKGADILDGIYAKNEALNKPFDLTDAYNEIANLSYDVWDKLGIESGGEIYNSDVIQKKLANEYEKSGVDAAYMKYNAAQRRKIREMLTDENQHSLRNYFALRGYDGEKEYDDYKTLYEDYISEKRKFSLNPANIEYQPKKKYAKGGSILKRTTYVPNRDVKELMVVLKGELTKLKGKDILDGVYVKNNRKPAGNKNAAKELLALFKKEAVKKSYGEVGIDESDIEKLFSAGLSEQDVKNVLLGYSPSSVKADTEFGSTIEGIISYVGDYQKKKIDEIVTNVKNGYYEIGLKYPKGFDWKTIINKYKISKTPKVIYTKTPRIETEFEIYLGDGVVVGHIRSYNHIGDDEWSEPDVYGELDSENPKFENGYWGIVTKKKEDMYFIVDTLLKQSKGYVKDIALFNNNLGGIGSDDVANEKFRKGGVSHSNRDLYLSQLASMSTTRINAVKEWASSNDVSDDELLNIIQGLGRNQISRMDFVSAVLGDKKATKMFIDFAKSKEAFRMAKGGKIGFKGLSEKVAKYYANKSVPSKYQTLYGKKYDKAEAKEVGDKVAAKVYRQQQAKK